MPVLLAFIVFTVGFSFFSTKPRDWLGRMSPKWPILCQMGHKTLTQSVSQSLIALQCTGFFGLWQQMG